MDTIFTLIFCAGLILALAGVLLLSFAVRSLATMASVMTMAHAPEIEAYNKAKQALPVPPSWDGNGVLPRREPESG